MEKNKKLKIAFVHPDLGIGGAERLVLDVADALKKQNHEVIFLTNHFDKTHAFDELKNDQYPVKVYGDWLPRSLFGKCQALCAYFRMIYLSVVYILFGRKEYKPDLYFVDLIPISIPFLKLANEKVVYYCHHPDLLASTPGGRLKKLYRWPIDWLEMKTTSMADVILVNSEYTASVFRKTFPSVTKQLQILYPTIANSYEKTVGDIKQPKEVTDLVPEIKRNDAVVFLSINRFHPAKKLHFAIQALAKLKQDTTKEEWDRIYLILAGGYDPQSQINADTYSSLLKLAEKKSVKEKVFFIKSPSDNFKAELLLSCSCLIYTPEKEHFGIVPLEAMLVSKPVLAVNSGGPRETVDHGNTGFLCEPTPDSLAEFMHRILRLNKTEIKEMGKKGKKRLEAKFSNTSFGKCLEKIVKKFIEDSKKGQ